MVNLSNEKAIATAVIEWLLAVARAEANAGCPRLFAFLGKLPLYFADVAAQLSADARFHLMSARIKRLLGQDMRAAPMDLTDEEQAACAQFDYPDNRTLCTPGKPHAEHVFSSTGIVRMMDADKVTAFRRDEAAGTGAYKIDRTRLRKECLAAMEPTFGKAKKVGGGYWVYWTPVAGVVVETTLDFAVRAPTQFRYFQRVFQMDVNGAPTTLVMSFKGMCGLLGAGQSDWEYVTDEEIPATAALLVALAREFVDALPCILERAGEIERAAYH